jgi:hypothetical protein
MTHEEFKEKWKWLKIFHHEQGCSRGNYKLDEKAPKCECGLDYIWMKREKDFREVPWPW